MTIVTFSLYLVAAGAMVALLYAVLRSRWIRNQPVTNEKVLRISSYIREGAMAFLYREYRVLLPFVLAVALFLAVANSGVLRFQAAAFVVGALASAGAGFAGMRVATAANARTTCAAQHGISRALSVAFAGGSVMGFSVVGFALAGLVLILATTIGFFGGSVESLSTRVLPIVSGYSLGASLIALFARVGGGIFTKAADVGADLVGKVEAGIPEDDHRNPATIADNVGDNVGDVAGMGADLFESYVGSLVGAMVLGIGVAVSPEMQVRLMLYPLILAVLGVFSSLAGLLFVRMVDSNKPQRALNTGTFGAAGLTLILAGIITPWFLPGGRGIFAAVVLGMAAGTLIGIITEYYTGTNKKPVNDIVRACETGAATTLITGMGVGMTSSFPPIVIIGATIVGGFALAGLYGVAVAAVGMLMTLGIQLAVDAYGPIADNAGGLAEMGELPPGVRQITDKLDAVGNTTAAIGKGFAIGSAALTSIILFSAFQQQVGIGIVDLMHIPVLVGILLGSAIPYLFSAMAMHAIGDAAHAMIAEVRRQFREIPGILEETAEPDYRSCVEISTSAALRKMILPGIVAALAPIVVGFTGGIPMLMGLLVGVTGSGVVLAVFMSNSGGAWDNAKKMIEDGAGDGKGSESHKAAVVGDTVGDPFKDTAGPSLNILIKLMAVISLVIAPLLKAFWRV